MFKPLNLERLKETVIELASVIDAPEHLLPTFGYFEDGSRMALFITESEYQCYMMEHGRKYCLLATENLDEVLYKIFVDVCNSMAGKYEIEHRVQNQDPRRLLFERTLSLLAKLNDLWAKLQSEDIERILQIHPYDDNKMLRVEYAQKLQRNNVPADKIERMIYEEYPRSTS